MNKSEIGIGIIDIYDDASLINCVKSFSIVPENEEISNFIITNRKNPTKGFQYDKVISHESSMANLRNHCIAKFRCLGLKYIFLITSNVVITDPRFIEKTIKTAEAFGTWLLVGNSENPTILDDTEKNQTLHVNTRLNINFVFIRSGVVGSLGYFDESYINTTTLDILDYVNKARKNNIYPPHPYHPTVGPVYDIVSDKIERIGHSDLLDRKNPSVGFSYGYFRHFNGYIPDVEDIKCASKDDLMNFMGGLQEDHGQ